MMIYCSDPKPQNLMLKDKLLKALSDFIDSGLYVMGPQVEIFEKAFANYIGVDHALGVANATDALEIALKSAGVKPGDEVITTSLTAAATICAIVNIGGIPVYADIEAEGCNFDIDEVEKKISANTKCIIAVHIHGIACEIERLLELCKTKEIFLLEDCSQAHGAKVNGRRVGSFGDAACFSFYPTKNLAALGDGGSIVTNNVEIYKKAKHLHQYGWENRICVVPGGRNSRLDELQASFLNIKLTMLDGFNEERRRIAGFYSSLLDLSKIKIPKENSGCENVFHQYVVQVKNREEVIAALKAHDFQAGIHYEIPVHRQSAFKDYYSILEKTDKRVTEIISLPIYFGLEDQTIIEIGNIVNKVASE